jgi:hypothetical protein
VGYHRAVLERLSVDSFAPAVGEKFGRDAGEGGTIELELLEARLHDADAPAEDETGVRAPFSVTFRGPPDPVLAQGIHPLEHPSLGTLEIFIVPIRHEEDGTTYEAVFA